MLEAGFWGFVGGLALLVRRADRPEGARRAAHDGALLGARVHAALFAGSEPVDPDESAVEADTA